MTFENATGGHYEYIYLSEVVPSLGELSFIKILIPYLKKSYT